MARLSDVATAAGTVRWTSSCATTSRRTRFEHRRDGRVCEPFDAGPSERRLRDDGGMLPTRRDLVDEWAREWSVCRNLARAEEGQGGIRRPSAPRDPTPLLGGLLHRPARGPTTA